MYARLDDRYDDHRKVRRAWRRAPAAVALHAMAISYCHRHDTDGLIERDRVQEWMDLAPGGDGEEALSVAVEVGLIDLVADDLDHLHVHGYLDHNNSHADRQRSRDAGRRAAQARWGNAAGSGATDTEPAAPHDAPPIADADAGRMQGDDAGRMQTPMPRREGNRREETLSGSAEGDDAAAPPPPRSAKRRRPQPPDPDVLPSSLPEPLQQATRDVAAILGRIARSKGAKPVALLAVGRVVEQFPRHDHRAVAAEAEHYWTFGGGASKSVRDVVATYRNRLDALPAPPNPSGGGSVLPFTPRERDLQRPGESA